MKNIKNYRKLKQWLNVQYIYIYVCVNILEKK